MDVENEVGGVSRRDEIRSSPQRVLVPITNVGGVRATGASSAKKRPWNSKREGIILRDIVDEVLLTRESSRGRANLPQELGTIDLEWKLSKDRRAITDEQWLMIANESQARGLEEHFCSVKYLKKDKVREALDSLGVARAETGGSRTNTLSGATIDMLAEMCPALETSRQNLLRYHGAVRKELTRLFERTEEISEQIEMMDAIVTEDAGETGNNLYRELLDLRSRGDSIDVKAVDDEDLRSFYGIVNALIEKVLHRNGAELWVRDAYAEQASAGTLVIANASQTVVAAANAEDLLQLVELDESGGAVPAKKTRRTPGKGTAASDVEEKHALGIMWLRTAIKRLISSAQDIAKHGQDLIMNHKVKIRPKVSWFCVWHDGESKTDAGSVWTRDGGVLLALHRLFAGLPVRKEHKRVISIYASVSKILGGEPLSMQDVTANERSDDDGAPATVGVRRSRTT